MESVKTILAIDDNRDILYTLEQIFNFQGWRPLLANGYEEADKLIKKEKIDLILVDYHMPGVDGISAVKEIRKKLPKVPIIVLTIEEEDRIVSKFMAAGADDYSLKPIKAVDLISRIKVHLQYLSLIHICNYMTGVMGRKTAVLEWNTSGAFGEIQEI